MRLFTRTGQAVLLLLAVALALALGNAASADATIKVFRGSNLGNLEYKINFDSGDADGDYSTAVKSCPSMTAKFTQGNTAAVSLYQVGPDETDPEANGTLVYTFTASTTTLYGFSPGTEYIAAVVDTVETSPAVSTLTLNCSHTISSGGGGASGAEAFDVCRSGSVPGGGYDAATGRYAWTCGNYNWNTAEPTASYFIDCTGDGTPHTSCLHNGERRLIGALHRIGLAVDHTRDGGTVYLPIFPGKEAGIYVYDGCGTLSDGVTRAQCPDPYLPERAQRSDWADTGPHFMRKKIQINRGVTVKGEGKPEVRFYDPGDPTVDDDTPRLLGTHVAVDLGNNPGAGLYGTGCAGSDCRTPDGPGEDIYSNGYAINIGWSDAFDAAYCAATSDTDATCVIEQDDQTFYQESSSAYGVLTAITSTSATNGFLGLSNSVSGTTDATYTGVCRENRLIRCGNAGASSPRASHGCDFGDVDYGVCEGVVDALQYDTETLGQDLMLAFDVVQCKDNPTTGADCDGTNAGHATYLSYPRTFAGSTGDAARNVFVGWRGEVAAGQRAWPFPFGDYNTGGATPINRVYVVHNDRYFQGGTLESVGIYPASWIGRDSATAAADCLSLDGADGGSSDGDNADDEAACDTTNLVGMGQGSGAVLRDWLIFNGSMAKGTAGILDNRGQGRDRLIEGGTFTHRRRGLGVDLCSAVFRNNRMLYDQMIQPSLLVAQFCQDVTIENNLFSSVGSGAPLVQFTSHSRNMSVENNHFKNTKGNTLQLDVTNNARIIGNHASGLEGYFAVMEPGNTEAGDHIKQTVIAYNSISGRGGAGTSGADAFIQIESDDESTTRADKLIGVSILGNNFVSQEANMCGVWIEDDVAGDANAQVDETRPALRIEGNSLTGPSGRVTCIGDYRSTGPTDATDSREPTNERYQPVMLSNFVNGVPEPENPRPSSAAADAPDCDLVGQGVTVAIHNDTALGACTDTTPADGVLDGGGTSRSVCVCDGAGTWSPM